MRIAVVGLGAVGGWLAARLALAGHEVSALARGATLAAVRERGLLLTQGGSTRAVALRASADPAELGPHDLVIVAVKGPALRSVAEAAGRLSVPGGVVLTAMNGVPWWFMQAWRDRPAAVPASLASVDPDGRIASALPLERVLGCVVHMAASAPEPGHVRHTMGDRLIVGEPAGPTSERVLRVAAALREGGVQVEASDDLRRDLWFKLWGNLTMNPVSALTGATCDRILDDPLAAAFCLRCMAEAAQVGVRVGCPIGQSGEERMAVTRQLGAFKTSMLQDVEAGRPLELDALVASVVEIARAVGLATPNIDALLGLTRLMATTRGLVPANATGAAPAGSA